MAVQNERFGIDVILNDRNFQTGMARVMRDMQRTTQETNRLGSSGDSMGKKLGGAFASIGGAIAKAGIATAVAGIGSAFAGAIKVGSDYTKQMSKVEAISGSTSLQMAELGVNARKLGAETKWSATNVAEAYEYMAMAGWNSNQMLDASLPLLNLATAGALDLGKAADIVTDTMTPFGLAASEAGRVADVFAVAQSKANLNVEMLGETMKYAAPIAATFGASLEDTTVVAMQFANGGIKASMAGTALRAGLSRLAQPPKPAAEALANLGVATTKTDGTMKGLRDIIGELSPKFNELTNQQQVAAAKAIFGEEAYAGWIMVLKNGLPEFDRMHELLDTSSGSAEVMANIMANNLSGAMDNAKSAAENLGLILFSRIEGGLTAATNGTIGWMTSLSQALDPMGNMVEATKLMQAEDMKLAQNKAILKKNLDDGKISQDQYNQGLADADKMYKENTTSEGIYQQKLAELDQQLQAGQLTQEAYNQKKDEARVFSDNMGKAVETEKQKQAELGEKIEWLQGIFEKLWAIVKPIWDDMASFIGEQINKIKKFIDENGKEIETVWNAVWGIIKFFTESVWEGIKDIISGGLDIIMGIIKTVGALMNGDWESAWEGIKQTAGGAIDLLWGIFEVGFGKLVKLPIDLLKGMGKSIGKFFGGLGKDIGKYIDDIVKAGSEGWTRFIDDAKRIMGTIKDWVTNPVKEAKKLLEGIDWGDVGRGLIQSLIDGIWSMSKWLGSTVSSVGSMLNPLKWFRSPDTPIGNISGGQLMSPTAEFGPSAMTSGILQAPSGMAGLSAVMDTVNDSLSSMNSIAMAGSRGGKYSYSAPNGDIGVGQSQGEIVVQVPVYLDKYQIASATGVVNQQEATRLDSRTVRGSSGSKYF
ncbi:tail tape measeure protein [Bacillus phage BC-7]|nr:tail tape measeure protein [Bacillus phage BC-7]